MRKPERRAAVELARVLLGCRLAGADDAAIAWWSVWLDSSRAAGFTLDMLEVSVGARSRSFGCALWGPREMVDRLAHTFLTHDVIETETDKMFNATIMAGRREHQIGTWARQLADGFEGGWAIRGDLDVSLARAIVGDAPLDTIASVCEQFHLEEVSELTRVVSNEAQTWDVELPLGAAPLDYVWNAVMEAFGLPDAGDALQSWLELPAESTAALSIRFFGSAPVAVRLTVPVMSSTELAAGLVATGIAESADERLAAVAGALDAKPWAATLVRDADGSDLEVRY